MLHRFWKLPRAIAISAGVLVLLVTFTPLVPWAARPLADTWTDTDRGALVVLMGGVVTYDGPTPRHAMGEDTYWRAMEAVRLWRQGHFRTVLLSGTQSGETVKPFLLAYGIPESAILLEENSRSTHQSALNVKPLLAGLPGPFVLVTSDYHTYRAKRCFAREHVPVETMPAPDLLKRSNSLAKRWQAFWDVAAEYGKIAYYRVKGWI